MAATDPERDRGKRILARSVAGPAQLQSIARAIACASAINRFASGAAIFFPRCALLHWLVRPLVVTHLVVTDLPRICKRIPKSMRQIDGRCLCRVHFQKLRVDLLCQRYHVLLDLFGFDHG